MNTQSTDLDPQETREWLEALEAIIAIEGPERAAELLGTLSSRAAEKGVAVAKGNSTDYVNTISTENEPAYPGDRSIERRIRDYIRWNAAVMVLRVKDGHIASYASAANLYEVGFNHFWQGPEAAQGADLIYYQGHSSPGFYSRAFLEGRLTQEQVGNFRRETGGNGLSSYPHPWLMPHFWQFPTVSMGLGPMQAIYQARFQRYLHSRGLTQTDQRHVWCFCGDGEMDEPESRGALNMAGREKLSNLIFVINCNLQRLDGPVRGNGKIIQELESEFAGCGWNVIKVIWGSGWDRLLEKDTTGALRRRMMECPDGDYQTYRSRNGAYIREHFFNTPELKELVANLSDDEIWGLNRGGHDSAKIYAAYQAAMASSDKPTVILAHTVKGFGMGKAGEAMNTSHQAKKMDDEQLKYFRDRFSIPIPDAHLPEKPLVSFEPGTPEYEYLHARRKALNGYLPARKPKNEVLPIPPLTAFDALLTATAEGREISTTMAFVRMLGTILKQKGLGERVVPIVADESRTFGMEGMFRQLGIWNQDGQQYVPQDSEQLMYYREDVKGQILQEGINEGGAMCDWIAAGTSYAVNQVAMVPFYIFYSMFGFQRTADFIWAAADQRSRGFLLGGTSGRTTLNGEGLQHQDGHSHLFAATVPNCKTYDPTFAYEVAVIVQQGLAQMFEKQEDVFYYITLLNENYAHPAMPDGIEADIIKGMYSFRKSPKKGLRVQLLGSGSIFREVMAAAELLEQDWDIAADLWSCPGFVELHREGVDVERWNLLHPDQPQRKAHVTQCLENSEGPIIAATDYIRAVPELIRAFVPRTYRVLGTDGFGRSDTRENLRKFFEVDRYYVTVAALKSLADAGSIPQTTVTDAIAKYGIDVNKPNPLGV